MSQRAYRRAERVLPTPAGPWQSPMKVSRRTASANSVKRRYSLVAMNGPVRLVLGTLGSVLPS